MGEQITWMPRIGRKRTMSRTLYLDQPSNLYLADSQVNAYLQLMGNAAYSAAFHNPTRDLITKNVSRIVKGLQTPVHIIDLGPGYPDKTFPLLENLDTAHCIYIPVDIGKRFLKVAVNAVKKFHIKSLPQHSLFEDMPKLLATKSFNDDSVRRLVVLGLTFMNYRPTVIVGLLRKMMRPGDVLVVAAEIRKQSNAALLIKPYQTKEAELLNWLSLKMVGAPVKNLKYFARFRYGRVEMAFKVVAPFSLRGCGHLRTGDVLVTAISYRLKLADFKKALRKQFKSVQIFTRQNVALARAMI